MLITNSQIIYNYTSFCWVTYNVNILWHQAICDVILLIMVCCGNNPLKASYLLQCECISSHDRISFITFSTTMFQYLFSLCCVVRAENYSVSNPGLRQPSQMPAPTWAESASLGCPSHQNLRCKNMDKCNTKHNSKTPLIFVKWFLSLQFTSSPFLPPTKLPGLENRDFGPK